MTFEHVLRNIRLEKAALLPYFLVPHRIFIVPLGDFYAIKNAWNYYGLMKIKWGIFNGKKYIYPLGISLDKSKTSLAMQAYSNTQLKIAENIAPEFFYVFFYRYPLDV